MLCYVEPVNPRTILIRFPCSAQDLVDTLRHACGAIASCKRLADAGVNPAAAASVLAGLCARRHVAGCTSFGPRVALVCLCDGAAPRRKPDELAEALERARVALRSGMESAIKVRGCPMQSPAPGPAGAAFHGGSRLCHRAAVPPCRSPRRRTPSLWTAGTPPSFCGGPQSGAAPAARHAQVGRGVLQPSRGGLLRRGSKACLPGGGPSRPAEPLPHSLAVCVDEGGSPGFAAEQI